MADETAFFYGTLMAPKILYRVCFGTTTPQQHQSQFINIRPALLRGYRRHRVKDVDYPGVVPTEGGSVLGTYVTGLSPQDIFRLDCFEGAEYERRRVPVQVLRGGVDKVQEDAAAGVQAGSGAGDVEETDVLTQTYVYLNKQRLEPQEWDFDEFKRDKMAAWTLDSSDEYDDIPADESADAADRASDGTGGRGAGGSITRQLNAAGGGHDIARAAV